MGGEATKMSSVLERHIWFQEGCENVKDDERRGHPRPDRTYDNVKKVWNLVHSNRCLSIRAMAM
jgi:hypothetical protein